MAESGFERRGSLPLLLICSSWNMLLLGAASVIVLMNAQARDALLAMSFDGVPGFLRLTATVLGAVICGTVNWHMLRRVQMLVYPLPPKQFGEEAESKAGRIAQASDSILGPAGWLGDRDSIRRTGETIGRAYSLEGDDVARHLARLLAVLPLFALSAVLVALPPDMPFVVLALLSVFVFVGAPIAMFAAASTDFVGRAGKYLRRTAVWFLLVWILAFIWSTLGTAGSASAALIGHGLAAWVLCVGLYAAAQARRSADAERALPTRSVLTALKLQFVPGGGWTGWGPLVVCGLLLVVFAGLPARSASLGPLAILLIGVAFWGAFGSAVLMAVYTILTRNKKSWLFVVIGLSVVGAVILFKPSDKRLIRTIESASEVPPLRSVRDALSEWPMDEPVVLVAAEGGGIYAAYHAAVVLSHLEDAMRAEHDGESFGARIFAISGVSGGSVGASVYAGLLKVDVPSMKDASDAVLSGDMLSAVLAAAVSRDLVPVPWPPLDRTRALEDAFAHSWAKSVPGRPGLLRESLSELDPDPGRGPNLFLNTTQVATGEPRFVGPLRFEPRADDRPSLTHVCRNIREDVPDVHVSIATAAVLSARFPIVTTSGQAFRGSKGRVSYVDGGYFENSGCATLEQVFRVIREERPIQKVIVIRIGAHSDDLPNYGWGDLLSPVATLANTRRGHGLSTRLRLEELVRSNDGGWFEVLLRLNEDGHEIPLGWLLSQHSRDIIRDQVVASEVLLEVLRETRAE